MYIYTYIYIYHLVLMMNDFAQFLSRHCADTLGETAPCSTGTKRFLLWIFFTGKDSFTEKFGEAVPQVRVKLARLSTAF